MSSINVNIKSSFYADGVDFYFGSYNVTFPAGITSSSVNITVVDDNILEGNEDFHLNISNSLPDRVTLNDTNSAIVIIKDNDGE